MDNQVLRALKDGYDIHYASVTGAVILLSQDGKECCIAKITLSMFCSLIEEGLIEHKSSMRQGHHIFHGRVDIYNWG